MSIVGKTATKILQEMDLAEAEMRVIALASSQSFPGYVQPTWAEKSDKFGNKQPVFGTAFSRQWASMHAPFTMKQMEGEPDLYIICDNKGHTAFLWGTTGGWCREQAELIVERSNTAAAIHLMEKP